MDEDELERYFKQKEKPILLNNRYIWSMLFNFERTNLKLLNKYAS